MKLKTPSIEVEFIIYCLIDLDLSYGIEIDASPPFVPVAMWLVLGFFATLLIALLISICAHSDEDLPISIRQNCEENIPRYRLSNSSTLRSPSRAMTRYD